MVSLGDVGDGLNGVLNKAAEAGAALRTAAELAEDARGLLGSAVEGSLQADVEAVNAQFTEAIEGIAQLHHHLGVGVDGTQKVLHRLEFNGNTSMSVGAPRSAASPAIPTQGEPLQRGDREQVDQLRQDLPQPVQPRSGQKTHGRWFTDADAPGEPARELASGHDEWWEIASRHLLDLGVPGAPVTAAHVEVKIAVYMARNGIRHATVVQNNTPCKGRFGCDTLVPVVFPKEAA